jgi:glycosyltransferase involved in cell wall biosynthesis
MTTIAGERQPMTDERVRFSVIIPTFQRRDVVVATVRALARQSYPHGFEVVVVVDGSTDGTADALRSLVLPFGLRVLEQPNRGSAAARNAGANAARGDLLLFLDDDMEAHPDLLLEHERSHEAGAGAVMGDIPLHPESPRGLLAERVRIWTEDRANRLRASGRVVALDDMLTGQLSVGRALFERLAGFDTAFHQQVTSGNADTDFGCRLLETGAEVVFNPVAVSWQRYVVTPRSYLRRFREVGRADVRFVRKHPGEFDKIFTARKLSERRWWMLRPQGFVLRWAAILLARSGRTDRRAMRWFAKARWCEYWLGVADAGGIPQR